MDDAFKKLGVRVTDEDGYLKSTSDILRDVLNAIELQGDEQTPLLQIELKDEKSIPKVFYKGEEITGKAQINFDWITRGSRNLGGMKFNIEHADEKGIVHVKGRKVGDLR